MRRSLPLAFVLAMGCGYAGDDWYADRIQDVDGDGFVAVRFGGPDCDDTDASVTICDVDGDGQLDVAFGGEDCDDTRAAVFAGAVEICDGLDNDCNGLADNDDPDTVSAVDWFVDLDGDGFGDPDAQRSCQEYADPDNPTSGIHSELGTDCDDEDRDVEPTATELCDGIDNNCDGVVDDAGLWFIDEDGDGFGVSGAQFSGACDLEPGSGLAAADGDCDDAEPGVNPGADESPYDGVDANCTGLLDDYDVDGDGHVPGAHWAAALSAQLVAGTDWGVLQGDCDDDDPTVHVDADETCDGVDNDCDGLVDTADLLAAAPGEEAVLEDEVGTFYLDLDGDGAHGEPVVLCLNAVDPSIHQPDQDDCREVSLDGEDPALIHPGASEICDGLDNDCDGLVDWDDQMAFAGGGVFFLDEDRDNVGADVVYACDADPDLGIVGASGDCNDDNSAVFPGAVEVCGDPVRQDCLPASPYDCDADGFEGAYAGGGAGEDCSDEDADVNPGVPEVCDGVDNDCDALLDGDDPSVDLTDLPSWYVDLDEDGWGTGTPTGPTCQRPGPQPHAIRGGDCDDLDEGITPESPWYLDEDGDGFGQAGTEQFFGCEAPSPEWSRESGDCNDADAELGPDTAWVQDLDGDFVGDGSTLVQSCSSPGGDWVLASNGIDCNDADPLVQVSLTWYLDGDADGFGDPDTVVESCEDPSEVGLLYVLSGGDCDDDRADVSPDKVETCNGFDDDCDGSIDDADNSLFAPLGGPLGFVDADGDGVGSPIARAFCSVVPDGFATSTGDCDDDDPDVFPGAIEVCGNDVDEDCNGELGPPSWFADVDGDGFGAGPAVVVDCIAPGPDYATVDGDCDDVRPATYPGAPELDTCDGIDSNCDGELEPRITWYFDVDGDGYGADETALSVCTPPTEPPSPGLSGDWVLTGGDCDDTESDVTFGRIWYADGDGDGLGNDASSRFECPQFDALGEPLDVWLVDDVDGDGAFDPGDVQLTIFGGDCDDTRASVAGPSLYYVDADEDGWGGVAPSVACPDALGGAPDGFVVRTGDCDDDDAAIAPDASEVAGDGIDSNCDGQDEPAASILWYPDSDGDGYGDGTVPGGSYLPGFVTNSADCDDSTTSVINGIFVYPDLDGDSYGSGAPSFVGRCSANPGESLDATDCDDGLPSIHPGVPQDLCDTADSDCDGVVDEDGWVDGFVDLDDDGFGAAPTQACATADGFSTSGGDCDDHRPDVHPGAVEVCDGIDNDCVGGETVSVYYLDADADGQGSSAVTLTTCETPSAGWVDDASDCDDGNSDVYMGAPELCDGLDNDCDGGFLGEADEDSDGVRVCDADCDDENPAVFPGADEVCDGVDNNCDGARVDGDPDVSNPVAGTALVGAQHLYVGDQNADGTFSWATAVATCEPHGAVAVFDVLGLAYTVRLPDDEPALHANCDDGSNTSLSMLDSDGDGVGAYTPQAPPFVLCGGLSPAGYIVGNFLDCAPDDPELSRSVPVGWYGDADGDGVFAPYSDVGACVPDVHFSAGEDCNDLDRGTTGRTAINPVRVRNDDEMGVLLQTCRQAEFALDADVTRIPIEEARPNSRLTFRQSESLPCSLTDGSGCVTITGDLDTGAVDSGFISIPNQPQFTFEDMGVDGTWTYGNGTMRFERVDLLDMVAAGYRPFPGSGSGYLSISDSNVRVSAGSGTFSIADGEVSNTQFLGEGSSTGVFVDLASYVRFTDVEFTDLAVGLDLARGGSVELNGVAFTDVVSGVTSDDTGTVSGTDIEFVNVGTAMDVDAAYLQEVRYERGTTTGTAAPFIAEGGNFSCTDCEFDVRGYTDAVILAPDAFGGQAFLTRVHAVGDGNGVLLRGSGGTLEDVSVEQLRVYDADAGLFNLMALDIDGLTVVGDADGPLIDADTGSNVTVENVDVSGGFRSDPVFQGSGGFVTLRDWQVDGVEQIVELGGSLSPFMGRPAVIENIRGRVDGAVSPAFRLGRAAELSDIELTGASPTLLEVRDGAAEVHDLVTVDLDGRWVSVGPFGQLDIDDARCERCGGADTLITNDGQLQLEGVRILDGTPLDVGISNLPNGFTRLEESLVQSSGPAPLLASQGDLLVERTTFHATTGPTVVLTGGTAAFTSSLIQQPAGLVATCGVGVDAYFTNQWVPTAAQVGADCDGGTGFVYGTNTGPANFDTGTWVPLNPDVANHHGEFAQ